MVPQYDSALFKIHPFKELQAKGEEIYSPPLRVGGLTWRLKIYPVRLCMLCVCVCVCVGGYVEFGWGVNVGGCVGVFMECGEGFGKSAGFGVARSGG